MSPKPTEYFPENDGASSGQPARLWKTNVKLEKRKTPGTVRFERRVNIEDHDNYLFVEGDPGYRDFAAQASAVLSGDLQFGTSSYDVSDIQGSDFIKKNLVPSTMKDVQLLSGGFIQIQEYCEENQDGRANYAIDVWGPVSVNVQLFSVEKKRSTQKTFTLIKRVPKLAPQGEPGAAEFKYSDSATLDWLVIGSYSGSAGHTRDLRPG